MWEGWETGLPQGEGGSREAGEEELWDQILLRGSQDLQPLPWSWFLHTYGTGVSGDVLFNIWFSPGAPHGSVYNQQAKLTKTSEGQRWPRVYRTDPPSSSDTSSTKQSYLTPWSFLLCRAGPGPFCPLALLPFILSPGNHTEHLWIVTTGSYIHQHFPFVHCTGVDFHLDEVWIQGGNLAISISCFKEESIWMPKLPIQ